MAADLKSVGNIPVRRKRVVPGYSRKHEEEHNNQTVPDETKKKRVYFFVGRKARPLLLQTNHL